MGIRLAVTPGPYAAGMRSGGGPRYGLDIETDTSANGLDPAVATVIAVAVAGPDGDTVLTGDEPELLARLDDHLAALEPGVLVTWNGACFDLPFLAHRAGHRGVPLGLEVLADPAIPCSRRDAVLVGHRGRWYGHTHLDAYQVYRRWTRTLGVTGALKAVARSAGLRPVEVDRERLHELDAATLRAYVASDARLAVELAGRCWDLALAYADDRAAPHALPLLRPA